MECLNRPAENVELNLPPQEISDLTPAMTSHEKSQSKSSREAAHASSPASLSVTASETEVEEDITFVAWGGTLEKTF